jgi:hypothetical protein
MVVIDQNQKFWWRIETTGGIAIVMQVLFGSYRASDFPMPSGWISPLIRRDGQGT